ncbi:MAG: glycerol-3-phosphate dehydrogenase [Clostridia bacterium]|nr:glycerol-3-phosphate dehydrogenase [Clostridia bacterium]
MNKISILGCGRWASFHAWYQIEKLKNDVTMWGRAEDEFFVQLMNTKKNSYIKMPRALRYSTDLKATLDFADTIIISISAQAMQEFSQKIGKCKPENKTFVLCMKGIDQNTGERLSEILRKNISDSNHICVWVGPGHIEELTAGQPNVMIISGDDQQTVKRLINMFESPLISILSSDDLIGVEVGAAAKNVMGIAAGFLDGLGKTSLKGALMARGCYEVSSLIEKMGGNKMTAFGMSHLGDFEATLFSKNSHNRRYGEEFIQDKLSDNIGTAEGIGTSKALYQLSQKYGVFMPITTTIYSILYLKADRHDVLYDLFKIATHREFNYE